MKNFAHFEEAKENIQSPEKGQDSQTSSNVDSPPVELVNPALAFRPVWLQEKVPMNLETGGNNVCQKHTICYISLIGNIEREPGISVWIQ